MAPVFGMLKVAFTVGGPAVGKGRPRFSTRGGFARSYTPATTREFEGRVADAARAAMAGRAPTEYPVKVNISVSRQIPKSWNKAQRALGLSGELYPGRIDVDNYAKAILDGMNKVIFNDDVQVISLTVSKQWAQEHLVEVSVCERL